jgi:glutamate-1-semialdehyde 2,1-aminomutase
VRLSGTYSANPISAVAARATLAELRKPGTYERLFAAGRTLMDALGRLLRDAGIPAQILGEPPAFEVFFADHEITDFRSSLRADRAAHARFVEGLLERGVVKAHEKFFLSLAHTGEDLALTEDAEKRMRAWMVETPEGKRGRQHSMEDVGLTRAQVLDRFAAYMRHFGLQAE